MTPATPPGAARASRRSATYIERDLASRLEHNLGRISRDATRRFGETKDDAA